MCNPTLSIQRWTSQGRTEKMARGWRFGPGPRAFLCTDHHWQPVFLVKPSIPQVPLSFWQPAVTVTNSETQHSLRRSWHQIIRKQKSCEEQNDCSYTDHETEEACFRRTYSYRSVADCPVHTFCRLLVYLPVTRIRTCMSYSVPERTCRASIPYEPWQADRACSTGYMTF